MHNIIKEIYRNVQYTINFLQLNTFYAQINLILFREIFYASTSLLFIIC